MIRITWRWLWGMSIRRQLIAGVALVHMLLMTFFVLDLVHRQQQFLLDRATKRVMFQTEVLATSSLHQVITQDLAGLAETLASLSRDRTIRYAMVTDPHGRVLGHTQAGQAGRYLQDATSRAVMKQAPHVKLVHIGIRTITATAPVMVEGRPIGWAWVASDLSADRAHLQYVTHAGLIYTLVAILVGTVFAVLLARAITRPLQLLLQGTERITQERLDSPIPIITDNEVGTVTRAFNAAMEKLAAQRDHLRASEERYRLLVDSVKDYAIVMLDPQGQVVSWNAGAERIKCYRAEEIVGQHFSLFYAPDDHADARAKRALQEAQAHGRFEDEGWRFRKDGSCLWANVVITAIYDPAGQLQGFAKITRDLTERRQAEEEIRLLNQDLERRVEDRTRELAVINQELDAFSYSVSHDLRAPLRSIDGFSQALLEDCDEQLDAIGQGHLQRIRSSTQRMGQLIDDLLDLSRLSRSELRRETVDLNALAATIADDLRHRDPDRQVEFAIAEGVNAQGDRRLLQVGLENLLGNAWKYTGKRSRARIEFGVTDSDGKAAYFVRDNGAGFDMAYADKLFGAFQRLHGASEFPGTGVGLATVQRIVHRHGGRVWAEAAVDQGATFFFTLEQERPDSGAPAVPATGCAAEPALCRR